MATLKRLEKRMNDVEKWLANFEKGTGPAQTMDNMNWLIGQCRIVGGQLQEKLQHSNELEMAFQQNNMALQQFLEDKDLVMDWQTHITKLQEEHDAVQKQQTEEVSVQEEAEGSEEASEAPSKEKEE